MNSGFLSTLNYKANNMEMPISYMGFSSQVISSWPSFVHILLQKLQLSGFVLVRFCLVKSSQLFSFISLTYMLKSMTFDFKIRFQLFFFNFRIFMTFVTTLFKVNQKILEACLHIAVTESHLLLHWNKDA